MLNTDLFPTVPRGIMGPDVNWDHSILSRPISWPLLRSTQWRCAFQEDK